MNVPGTLNRPSSEPRKSSSTSSNLSSPSLYSQASIPSSWTTISTHEYSVHYSKWRNNLIFSARSPTTANPSNITPVFLSRSSEVKPNAPDVTIHDVRGRDAEDKTAPILGVARFRWSRNVTMGLGDPANDPNGVVWEEMQNASKFLKHDKYRFEYTPRNPTTSFSFSNTFTNTISPPPPASTAQPRERKSYTWQRTHSAADGVEGWGRWSLANYKLLDDATGHTLAVFLSNGAKSWRKCGKLRVVEGLDDDMETLIVLSSASIAEKMRRRKQGAAAGGGGGGGS